jgi:5'/3'-nucleotidase
MTILLTNDDGIDSPGLAVLQEKLKVRHNVWIMAPDGDRSGKSQSITLKDAIRTATVSDRSFSCSGTPADCVAIAMLGAIPEKIDLVISGINLGPNLGTDIIYSGTAAAARQASLNNCPSIAVSLAKHRPPFDFEQSATFIADNVEILTDLWNNDHFVNINFPEQLRKNYTVEITHPSRRMYEDKLIKFISPNKDTYYFLSGTGVASSDLKGEDSSAILEGNISISPIYLHPVNHREDKLYKSAEFRRI